jgi:glycine cleavage system H protein
LPKVGDSVEAGKTFGSVESVKAVSDLFSPVSGTVTAVNDTLKDKPETINTDANTTWLLKVELSDAKQVDGLLAAAEYEKFISEETGH